MLREFSKRRLIGSFIYDWLATLLALLLAAILYAYLPWFPDPLRMVADFLGVGGAAVVPIQDIVTWLVVWPVFVIVGLIWPFYLLVFAVYDGRRNPTLKAELLNLFLAIGVSTMTLAGMLYFTYRDTPRGIFTAFFLLDLLFLLGARVLWSAYRRREPNRQANRGQRPVLIIGAGKVGRAVVESVSRFTWNNISVVGYVDDDPHKQGKVYEGIPVLGTSNEISTLVAEYKAYDAVVALPLHAHERMVETCRLLQDLSVHVRVVPDLFAFSFPSASLDGFGGIPLIDLGQPGIYGWKRTVKRAFDVGAASLLLLLFSPIMLIITLLIRRDSAGPIFYRQERVGENGRRFKMLKFRSMYTGSDSKLHREHVTKLIKQNVSLNGSNGSNGSLKLKKDPRITPVGHFIRKTSLDELPQFLNVLRGEMSLVGPRPPIPYEVEVYQPWHRQRLEAIPGITGIWQVNGRNQVSFDEMVRMDIEYIEQQSIWMDMKLLLLTPVALLTGRGAG
ncbi:MAG: sugar transferase [Ardenticatenaceae bacterium]